MEKESPMGKTETKEKRHDGQRMKKQKKEEEHIMKQTEREEAEKPGSERGEEDQRLKEATIAGKSQELARALVKLENRVQKQENTKRKMDLERDVEKLNKVKREVKELQSIVDHLQMRMKNVSVAVMHKTQKEMNTENSFHCVWTDGLALKCKHFLQNCSLKIILKFCRKSLAIVSLSYVLILCYISTKT